MNASDNNNNNKSLVQIIWYDNLKGIGQGESILGREVVFINFAHSKITEGFAGLKPNDLVLGNIVASEEGNLYLTDYTREVIKNKVVKQAKVKTFKFYTDPDHGWLAVKIDLLLELGIFNEITAFSYFKGKTAYLEEDQDVTTFFKAFEARFGVKPITKEGSYSNSSSHIRNFASLTDKNKKLLVYYIY